MPLCYCLRPAAVALACLIGGGAAAQDSVEQFYRGKQINIVVGSSAGGGYDTYARLIARTMGASIPGNPSIVVQNMSGAGSNRAAGYIYSVAPKDGTAIGAIFPGAVLQPLLSEQPVPHDPSKFVYLGSANSDVYVCYVRSDAPVKTFKDVLDKELIVGASNPGATTYDLPLLLNSVLGAKFKIVTGYPGSREITLALERGEVQGACGIGWTGIETMYPSCASEVTPSACPLMPHGTIPLKWPRSGSTLIAMPWYVTQRRTRTPIAAILSSRPSCATQMPTRPSRRSPVTLKRASVRMIHSSRSRTKRRTSGPRSFRSSIT